MRITFVVPALETSGGARIVAGHAQWLANKGHEVVIIVASPQAPSVIDRIKALLRGGSLPSGVERSHYARVGASIRVMAPGRSPNPNDVPDADVIIATFWTTVEWIWPLPAAKGVKVHFIQHYEAFPGIPADRVDAVWRLPISKIAICQWLVDLGRERFGIDKIALVPNSVDHDFFNPARRKPRKSDAPTVGFLFSGAAFKDVATSVAALERLKLTMSAVRILSFGAVHPSTQEVPAGIEFHYLPTQDEIAQIYSRCDAWLSTSRTEGFNLPPLEAMATGCPAVCSKTGRPLEIIKNGVNGYLVDQGDVDRFADALGTILSLSDAEWTAMSAAAVEAVAHPTWAESSRLFEQALMQSIAGQSYSPDHQSN